jgi:ubiquinone/menaquinone biosynthesis C-methylase UbiE
MSHYIHGSHPEEQDRLALLNQLINDRCFPKLKLKKGFRVLDVGSGLGQFTYQMSEAVGEGGFCLGIERDVNQISVARKNHKSNNLEFRQGDALHLPLTPNEWGTFDFAHTRFLLEHLPNPSQAVSQMVKALKPGGRIVLEDDDHESMILFPEPTGFKELWSAYMQSYIEVGNDPFIGRKLTKLLLDQGVKNIRNDVVFFGDCAGTNTFHLFTSNLIGVIVTSHPVMISSHLISEREYQIAIENIRAWGALPHASLWYNINVAEGTRL